MPRRIDDHKFWAGGKGKDTVFPDGPHKTKDESSAEGAGSLMHYEDHTEAIRATQEHQTKKIKGRPLRDGDRY